MAYKRNPMRSERLCSLARYVISLPINASVTSSTQWLERTLDDSANRRIVVGQAFLAVDAILQLYLNITENLVVYENVIKKHVFAELPFMATENIIMECVKNGGNRQDLHEGIRVLSMKAAENVKMYGRDNNLIELIKAEPMFASVKDRIDDMLNPVNFIGRAPSQVDDFIKNEIDPILEKNSDKLGKTGDIKV